VSMFFVYGLPIAIEVILVIVIWIYITRKMQHYRILRHRQTKISMPSNDDERLELLDIQHQLSEFASKKWAYILLTVSLGVMLFSGIAFEISIFFHVGGK